MDDQEQLNELTDVEVLTVGLVTRGANHEEIFLTKSDTTGDPATTPATTPDAESANLARRFWDKVRGLVRREIEKAQAIEGGEEEGEEEEADKEECAKSTPLPEQMADDKKDKGEDGECAKSAPPAEPTAEDEKKDKEECAKSDPSQSATPAQDVTKTGEGTPAQTSATTPLTPLSKEADMADDNEKVLLQKALDDLTVRLEKAETQARQERELRERQSYIAKADSFGYLPAKSAELGDFLYWLNKSDPARATYLEGLLRAVDNQLEDAGLFVEKGVSQGSAGEATLMEKADALVKTGKATDLKDALLKMDPKEQAAYIQSRQAAVRGK